MHIIHSKVAAKLNFACCQTAQTAFAFLRELRIENQDPAAALEDATVALSARPAFLMPKSWRIERVAPQSAVSLADLEVELDARFLHALTEAAPGAVTIAVEKDGETLATQTTPVELLARDAWGGMEHMPELLAAFAAPDDPAVGRVLRDAAAEMRAPAGAEAAGDNRAGGRARQVALAVYTAVARLGVTAAPLPDNFAHDGLALRPPERILAERAAHGLDAAMLFAAALEHAGLKPVAALTRRRALAGVWLQSGELPAAASKDAASLRAHAESGALLLFDAACVARHPPAPFSEALAAAPEALAVEDDFCMALDILRARARNIMPPELPPPPAPPAPAAQARGTDAPDAAPPRARAKKTRAQFADDDNVPAANRYAKAQFDGERHAPDAAAFYKKEYHPRLSAMIEHVIAAEGPIHLEVLAHRIAAHHGFAQVGGKIRNIVSRLANMEHERTKEKVGLFFWPKGADEEEPAAPARYQDRDDETRHPRHICREELQAIDALFDFGGDPQSIARRLGVRCTEGIKKRIEAAFAAGKPAKTGAR